MKKIIETFNLKVNSRQYNNFDRSISNIDFFTIDMSINILKDKRNFKVDLLYFNNKLFCYINLFVNDNFTQRFLSG
jgi:hypothetical protein